MDKSDDGKGGVLRVQLNCLLPPESRRRPLVRVNKHHVMRLGSDDTICIRLRNNKHGRVSSSNLGFLYINRECDIYCSHIPVLL